MTKRTQTALQAASRPPRPPRSSTAAASRLPNPKAQPVRRARPRRWSRARMSCSPALPRSEHRLRTRTTRSCSRSRASTCSQAGTARSLLRTARARKTKRARRRRLRTAQTCSHPPRCSASTRGTRPPGHRTRRSPCPPPGRVARSRQSTCPRRTSPGRPPGKGGHTDPRRIGYHRCMLRPRQWAHKLALRRPPPRQHPACRCCSWEALCSAHQRTRTRPRGSRMPPDTHCQEHSLTDRSRRRPHKSRRRTTRRQRSAGCCKRHSSGGKTQTRTATTTDSSRPPA